MLGLAVGAAVTLSGAAFGQDGAQASKSAKSPVSARSIRPFTRSETPANQEPNLYDANSDEFNYFREDLGRQELSTKQKARLAQIASRVVYADPMDKPAADGSKFIDIYSLDEVVDDGKPFVGADDPDVVYEQFENNALAQFSTSLDLLADILSLTFGVSTATTSNGMQGMQGSSPMYGSGGMPMPSVSMGPVMMEGGQMSGGAPGGPGGSSKAATPKTAAPSKFDDSKLIFPNGDVETTKVDFQADPDFDFFADDRAFEPKAAPANSMGGMGMDMNIDPAYGK